MEKIKVRSKDNKQFLLHEDGTYSKIENFKKGDIFECIKEFKTSGGKIKIGYTVIIDTITFCYWIKGLNCDYKTGGLSIVDWNEYWDEYFIKVNV